MDRQHTAQLKDYLTQERNFALREFCDIDIFKRQLNSGVINSAKILVLFHEKLLEDEKSLQRFHTEFVRFYGSWHNAYEQFLKALANPTQKQFFQAKLSALDSSVHIIYQLYDNLRDLFVVVKRLLDAPQLDKNVLLENVNVIVTVLANILNADEKLLQFLKDEATVPKPQAVGTQVGSGGPIQHVIYTASKEGFFGRSGYGIWNTSYDISEHDAQQLVDVCQYFPSADGSRIDASGLYMLPNGQCLFFKSSQGGKDDMGRETFMSDMFLSDIHSLSHPPYMYLFSPSFRNPLTLDEAKLRKSDRHLLESLKANELIPSPQFQQLSRDWLRSFAQKYPKHVFKIALNVLSGHQLGSVLIADEDELFTVFAFAVVWELATDDQKKHLSIHTLLPQVNHAKFTIARWPSRMGNPGEAYIRRFKGVIMFSRTISDDDLTNYPSELRQRVQRLFGI
jgi:hypothetical protein